MSLWKEVETEYSENKNSRNLRIKRTCYNET